MLKSNRNGLLLSPFDKEHIFECKTVYILMLAIFSVSSIYHYSAGIV